MVPQKPKSIQNIELRMETLDPSSYRYKVLETARNFKSSWITLGQYLHTVHKDKLYKDWGYLTFEAYCSKEIGVRQATAVKLLKSYAFLEKEEPAYLKNRVFGDGSPSQIPSYESVNALRLAKQSERISETDYQKIREDILEDAKEDTEVKKKIRYLLKANPRLLSREEKEKQKEACVRRILTGLRNAKRELQEYAFPAKVLKEVDTLIDLLSEFQQ